MLRPELASEILVRRVDEEQHQLANALLSLKKELSPFQSEKEQNEHFTVRRDQNQVADEFAFSLELGDETVTPSEDIQQLLESIIQDLGEIPDEYLEPASAGAYPPASEESEDASSPAKRRR